MTTPAAPTTPAPEAPPAPPAQTNGTTTSTTPTPTFTVVQPGQTTSTNPAAVYSAEDIAKARQQEKDKLYPQLTELKETVAELKKAADEKLAAEKKAREDAEEALRKQREEEMSAKELLEQQKAEFEARFEALQQEREQERTVLQMERAFQELQTYKNTKIAEHADDIIPQLVDELRSTNHSSPEEIDTHIARLVATSASIMENVQAAVQQQRAGMRGAAITTPPAGPLDTYSGNDSAWEAAQNGSLTFEDYVKNRDKFLSGVARNHQGIYG